MTKSSLLEIESTQIEEYAGDTKGQSIVVTAKGAAEKGETAQQYGQHGLISHPAKNTIGLRLTQGSLDIIIAGLNYSVPIPENPGETLLFSTDANGAVKSKLYLDKNGDFIFNDGEDFAVRYSKLEEAYNELQSQFNAFIDIFLGWVPVPNDGGAALKALITTNNTPPLSSKSTGDITPSKIEEIKLP